MSGASSNAGWLARLRALPLRSKLLVTALGAGIAVLGASTYLSFRYWHGEARSATAQQALLAAASTRTALESALRLDRTHAARRNIRELLEGASVTGVRVYGDGGRIILSGDPGEENRRPGAAWIPGSGEIPKDGLIRESESGEEMIAYLPLSAPGARLLEVEFSVAPVQEAMERGAILGIVLMIGSALVLVLILFTMLEREVVSPLQRMGGMLDEEEGRAEGRPSDEVSRIRSSVARLVEKERQVERLAEARTRQLEAQQGLAEVGELAAEMAHEFKRPLASIQTAVEMLQQEYMLEEGGKRMLTQVEAQLDRLSDTMGDLFSLAKPVVVERSPVAPADLLDDLLVEIAGYPGARQVTVERDYEDDLPPVAGEHRRLEQAFLNLLVNAVEAMHEGGTLTVAARTVGDSSVEVSIGDTGPGMTPEEVDLAFRPFHSTKPVGTGLGLPLVARIVAAHRGRIAVESEPGEGTTVRILLPRSDIDHLDRENLPWPESASSSWTMTSSSETS